MTFRTLIIALCIPAVTVLSGCNDILGGIYDEPAGEKHPTVAGELYIDASDWTKWHYIDLRALTEAVAADPEYNTSGVWVTMEIPVAEDPAATVDGSGIYTYWYDVFGAGISVNEFRSFTPAAPQPQPEEWTFAVHRNNVRTNGCEAAATGLASLDELPEDAAFYNSQDFRADTWNQNEVWVIQDRMLLGLIGNQGIAVNDVLSSWLKIDIPPMPPAFTLDSEVFVLRLPDGSMGALQLVDYQSATGTKCCLSIKYRYPL